MAKKAIRAWHFLADKDGKPVLRDGSPAPKIGEKLTVKPPLVICSHGLHASIRPIDALEYSPGPWACLVECGGEIVREPDKLCCSERTIIGMVDATRVLQYFACDCAAMAIETDLDANQELWLAVDMKLAWLDGLCSDDDLAAARAAAWDAARAAAWDAARAAAWAAARDAARDAENEYLEEMLLDAIGGGRSQ